MSRGSSGARGLLVISVVVLGACLAPATAVASSGTCANEAIRIEQASTFLANCRAYELVSGLQSVPKFAEVTGGQVEMEGERAAASGERMSYSTWYAPAGVDDADGVYLSRRGESGWTNEALSPPQSTAAKTGCAPTMYLSADLSAAVLTDGQFQTGQPYCGHNEPALVGEEPSGWLDESALTSQNVFLRPSLDGVPLYDLVNRTPASATPNDAWFQDASSDFSHVVFSEDAALTANSPAGEALYEWVDGVVHLVSVLPDGSPVTGAIVDATTGPHEEPVGAAPYMHAVSTNGSRVFFEANGALYLRENAEQQQSTLGVNDNCLEPEKACTVQIDASQDSGAGGGGTFLVANEDAEVVFFMDSAEAQLTSGTVPGSGENLYEYQVASGTLTDLTPFAEAGVDGVSGFAEDEGGGFYLYFVADGALAPGSSPGDCSSTAVMAGVEAGSCNLYEFHAGDTAPTFVAPLAAPTDQTDWQPSRLTARVSPDGGFIAFDSAARVPTSAFPAGYDNTDRSSGQADDEIYLYATAAKQLTCVSCMPDGSPPAHGGAQLNEAEATEKVASSAPGYLQRLVLEDGRVFFQTAEPLVSEDGNEVQDVYEYAAGSVHLISSGRSPEPSMLGEVSESGDDVFFATTQSLVGSDTDSGLSLYDARVDGGFPEPSQAHACESEGCRGGTAAAGLPEAPASLSFTGPGNLLSSMPTTVAKATAPEKTAAQIRADKLGKALKACKRKAKAKRKVCESAARKQYGRKVKTNSRAKKASKDRRGAKS